MYDILYMKSLLQGLVHTLFIKVCTNLVHAGKVCTSIY